MARIPIALQLYSVRDECAKDLPGVLKEVARMGYEGVEFAGYHGFDAPTLRSMLDELGLKCAGTHIMLNTLQGDALAETIAFNKTLGNKFLIVPWMPEELRNSKAAWLSTAATFNEISDKVRAEGMYVGYHNHDFEFTPVDGDLPWDIFFGNTKKDVVMQFDTGNAMHGGADAVPFLERYPGRALTIHLKEYSASDPNALVGDGDIPWGRIFELAETESGTEWYIVEQETYKFGPMETVEKCLQNLKKMGK